MSADDDKYPGESGRRRFVKGVVGGSALAAVGAAGSATINSATTAPGKGGGATQAMAIENTAGPAPRGMPQIPIQIDSEGFLKGVWPEVKTVKEAGREIKIAETEDYNGSGVTYSSEWFQYCGVETYEGIEPTFESDNYFKSGPNPGYSWQQDALSEGDRINVDLFDNYEEWGNGIGSPGVGKPATGIWRSEGTEINIPIVIIRSPVIEQVANGKTDAPQSLVDWVNASTQNGFIAWLNKCTHFCCVPGFKTFENAAKFDAENDVFCPCHQSVYDPFSIVETLFTARPRPTE